MTFQVVKLIPSDNFRMRIGKGRMDRIEDLVHADTLYSALVNVGIKLHGEERFIPLISKTQKMLKRALKKFLLMAKG